MYSSHSPYQDPRCAESSSRIEAVNPLPGMFVRPVNARIIDHYLRGSSQRVPPSSDWHHQAPSKNWFVTPPPIRPLHFWQNVPPPQTFYSAQPPIVRFPFPPPYHSDQVKNVRSPPRPVLPWHGKADPIDRTHQSTPSAIPVNPNALFEESIQMNDASTTQPRLDVDNTKIKHEGNDAEANECEKAVADGPTLHEKVSNEISGVTKSSPNRIDQLVSAKVEESDKGPKISKKSRLKVKSENLLLDPLIIKTEDQYTMEAKEETGLTTGQSNDCADIKRKNTTGHSVHDSSMDAISRDYVLYRFLVSEMAMKGLSKCMNDGETVRTIDEAQLVQDVLILLLFLKSHGDVALLCALGVVDVLAAQNVKGHFVVVHPESSRNVTLSISEHNYLKNFIRNVRPTLTKDSYGILFKNGESSFSNISLRQALRYSWAKAQVGLDASVLWGCLGQDGSDLDTFTDQDTRTFTATSASANQVPLVDQAVVGEPPNSETGEFSPSAAVLEDLEGFPKSVAEKESPAAAILEQQQPLIEETAKSVAVDTSPAAAIPNEQCVSRKRTKSGAVDTSPAASVPEKQPSKRGEGRCGDDANPKEKSVRRKRPKSVSFDTSPVSDVPEKQPVDRKQHKSVYVDISPAAAVPLNQPISIRPPKRANVNTSPTAANLKEQSAPEKRPKNVSYDSSSASVIPKKQPVSGKRHKSVDVDTSSAAATSLKLPVSRKRPKIVAEDASRAPADQASLDKNFVCSKRLEVVRKKKAKKNNPPNPVRTCKQSLEKQSTRWPVAVLHELRPGLKYAVSEERAPGLYYPVFEVSAFVEGQRFAKVAPSIKRAKFLLAQLTLKCVYNIDNVHEGAPTAIERKEAKRKTHNTR